MHKEARLPSGNPSEPMRGSALGWSGGSLGFPISYHPFPSSTAAMASAAVLPGSAVKNFSCLSTGSNMRLPSFRYGIYPRKIRCRSAFSESPKGSATSGIVRYFFTGTLLYDVGLPCVFWVSA